MSNMDLGHALREARDGAQQLAQHLNQATMVLAAEPAGTTPTPDTGGMEASTTEPVSLDPGEHLTIHHGNRTTSVTATHGGDLITGVSPGCQAPRATVTLHRGQHLDVVTSITGKTHRIMSIEVGGTARILTAQVNPEPKPATPTVPLVLAALDTIGQPAGRNEITHWIHGHLDDPEQLSAARAAIRRQLHAAWRLGLIERDGPAAARGRSLYTSTTKTRANRHPRRLAAASILANLLAGNPDGEHQLPRIDGTPGRLHLEAVNLLINEGIITYRNDRYRYPGDTEPATEQRPLGMRRLASHMGSASTTVTRLTGITGATCGRVLTLLVAAESLGLAEINSRRGGTAGKFPRPLTDLDIHLVDLLAAARTMPPGSTDSDIVTAVQLLEPVSTRGTSTLLHDLLKHLRQRDLIR